MDAHMLWMVLAALLVLAGLAGMVLPALPGAPLVLAGLVLAAWADDFRYLGIWWITVLVVLTAFAMLVDFVSGAFGAKKFGASPRAALGATIGAIAGIWFLPIGFFVGPFIGAVLGELSAQRTLGDASRAGVGATIGLVLGTAAKLALGIGMLGIYLFARLVHA
jgi:uncharacterized protein YqgC (DUF456 family)